MCANTDQLIETWLVSGGLIEPFCCPGKPEPVAIMMLLELRMLKENPSSTNFGSVPLKNRIELVCCSQITGASTQCLHWASYFGLYIAPLMALLVFRVTFSLSPWGHEKSSHEAVTWLQPDMEACSISYSFWGICLISSSIWNQTQKACMK